VRSDGVGVPSESFYLSDDSDDMDEESRVQDVEDDEVELTYI
jgi:hypothetical protein